MARKEYSIRCPMCGSYAVKGECNGCGYWFCIDHMYRHRECKEGR